MQLELITYGQAIYARKWLLRTTIMQADTIEAVRAVEIEFDTLSAPVLPQSVRTDGE